jgi:hypothetical protein
MKLNAVERDCEYVNWISTNTKEAITGGVDTLSNV